MKTKYIIFLLVFGFTFNIQSQDQYRITYDYKTDSTTYYKVNDDRSLEVLAKPKMKRNSMVEIQLKNINPFALKVSPTISGNDVFVEGNNFNIISLFGDINGRLADGKSLNLNIKTPNFTAAPSANAVTLITRSDTQGVNEEIIRQINLTNNLNKEITIAKDVFIASLVNPNLEKDKIKDNLNEVLGATIVSDYTIEEDFFAYLADIRQQLNGSNAIIANNVNKLKSLYQREITQGQAASNESLLEAEQLISSTNNAVSNSTVNLDTIQRLYSMLDASSFEQTTDFQIINDVTAIDLKFKKSDFTQETGFVNANELVKNRNIKLFARGGLKINTSVALTLNNFGDNSSDFYLASDNTIGADKNDFFVPSIATMINFYPFWNENINIGGSFGVSIPITDDITGINFLLGPSIFLGSRNRLSLSGGIAYGPVERLKDGLTVGETTNRASNEISRTVYDFGYFFGVSFSLFDVKN